MEEMKEDYTITWLDRSQNPHPISNPPSGMPTEKASKRTEFVAKCIEAIESGIVKAMRGLLVLCGEYPIMEAKLEKALKGLKW